MTCAHQCDGSLMRLKSMERDLGSQFAFFEVRPPLGNTQFHCQTSLNIQEERQKQYNMRQKYNGEHQLLIILKIRKSHGQSLVEEKRINRQVLFPSVTLVRKFLGVVDPIVNGVFQRNEQQVK